ncbi:hypothetical protein CC117_31605 [Parafrankia colletiae]|uniref:Uncharacterized protein n=1 Tax=Parafrankia colletiae TaxID=573497 RepID=A0A1S1PZZ3_9ACTN|nr:hypothetical protein [Parafrankia colletiae]MCK9904737.1 hypothetical protein [Frankia sp. Cpl3]OHV26412.1 hypothetical protein CC117_31605 [Parafrankia colletiae]
MLRSPEAEVLHASSDRVTFYDNQLGTFCANWAAVSLLDKLLDLDNPDLWGLEEADFACAAERPRFSDALTRFPAAAAFVAAAGRCSSARTRRAAVVLPDEGSGREATDWLDTHAGAAHAPKAGGAYALPDAVKQQHVGVRNAWTAPPSAELEQFVARCSSSRR